MKRKLYLAIISLLVITAVALAGCDTMLPSGGTTAKNTGQQTTGIWVSGTGEVTATPDIATLQVGVEAQGATVAGAQADATQAMEAVMAALTASGVQKADIQTRYFSIQELTKWDDATSRSVITGYQVTNTVIAKIRDMEAVGTIIDAAVSAGGDLVRIDNLAFSLDDPSIYYDEARQEAMADAKSRAEKLAKLAGVKLGDPTYINESSGSPPVYEISYTTRAVPAPTATPISPGEVKVTLTVQVAYEIQ